MEPLFTQIPIIASKSAGDFLKADSDSYSAGEFHDSESQPTHKGSAAEMTVAGQLPGQTGVGTTDTPTQASVATSESERPKSGRFRQKASLVNKLTAPSERANSSESEVATHKGVLSNSPVATRQHRPRSSDREPLEVRPRFNSRYSYETTDPSTFKDPIYNVPPIVRRQTRTNDAQPYSANPQADNRETTGRSRR